MSIENKEEKSGVNKILVYLYLIIVSPLFLRYRLQTSRINKILRYAIFIAFIYPLILPLHFMESINGKIGYIFFIFILLDNKANYEQWAVQMTFLYYATTLFPFILFTSGKKFYNKKDIFIIIMNGLLSLILWIISMIVNFLTVGQSLSLGFLFFSTSFIYVFIILLILFIIFFNK